MAESHGRLPHGLGGHEVVTRHAQSRDDPDGWAQLSTHAEETRNSIPTTPVLFGKLNNALAPHDGDIRLPVNVASKFDYEADDLSARELQKRTPQMLLGKGMDGFAPVGPWIVGSGLVANPDQLGIKSRVNRKQGVD